MAIWLRHTKFTVWPLQYHSTCKGETKSTLLPTSVKKFYPYLEQEVSSLAICQKQNSGKTVNVTQGREPPPARPLLHWQLNFIQLFFFQFY